MDLKQIKQIIELMKRSELTEFAVEEACRVALLAPLTDDPELLAGMRDLVSASLG